MSDEIRDEPQAEAPSKGTDYEPPAIESVMTPEDLTREVQYAGSGPTDGIGPG